MKTAFLTDPRFAQHETGPGHPERAARLTHTLDHLRACGIHCAHALFIRAGAGLRGTDGIELSLRVFVRLHGSISRPLPAPFSEGCTYGSLS